MSMTEALQAESRTNGDHPLISIGMSVRNNEQTVALAIRSILAQSYPHWELLLIDDGSSDRTLQIARSFEGERIKVHADNRSLGLPTRLNQAIELSQGQYFARMDGDDVAYPERLERQLRYLQEHPSVDLVGARVVVFGRDGVLLGKRAVPERHEEICCHPTAGFPMVHPTFMGRLSFFRRYRYQKGALLHEDQDLLLRASQDGRISRSPGGQSALLQAEQRCEFANVPEILLGYNEARLDLRKLLLSRYCFAKGLYRAFLQQKRIDLALRAVAEQGLRALADLAAVSTGLSYRLLRHRAQPVTSAERERWEQVWATTNLP